MKCYLTSCFAGFIALDENCTLLDYELFPRSKLTKRIIEIQKGNLTKEEESILKRMVKNCDEISIETNTLPSKYKNLKENHKFTFETPNNGGEFLRSNLVVVLKKTGFIRETEEMINLIHEISLENARYGLQQAAESEDLLLIQGINAVDDLDETTGKLAERLREWYSVHFPELDKIKSHDLYVKLVADYEDKDSLISSGVLDSDLKIEKSIGADIGESDMEMIKELAASLRSLQKQRNPLQITSTRRWKRLHLTCVISPEHP